MKIRKKVLAGYSDDFLAPLVYGRPPDLVDWAERRLSFLRNWQELPVRERRGVRPCVYLGKLPSLDLLKIGRSDDWPRRFGEHRHDLDAQTKVLSRFHTPVDLTLLERALHLHFEDFHVKDELFRPDPTVVSQFSAAAKEIESHLLAIEIFRMQRLLEKYQAAWSEGRRDLAFF